MSNNQRVLTQDPHTNEAPAKVNRNKKSEFMNCIPQQNAMTYLWVEMAKRGTTLGDHPYVTSDGRGGGGTVPAI